jgi:hypothetical protein
MGSVIPPILSPLPCLKLKGEDDRFEREKCTVPFWEKKAQRSHWIKTAGERKICLFGLPCIGGGWQVKTKPP